MLGVNATMGRVFVPPGRGPGCDQVAVLSFELWQRRYSSNPNILGSKIIVDDKPRTVVGVMPRGFQFFIKQQSFSQKGPELWVPMIFERKIARVTAVPAGGRIAASGCDAAAGAKRR